MIRAALLPLLTLTALTALGAAETPAPAPAPAPVPTPAAAPAPKPFLGVTVDENTPGSPPGLPVAEVKPMSTAAILGLESGDRLLTINTKPVAAIADLQKILGGSKVGEAIIIEFSRAGTTQSVTGTLLERPKPQNLAGDVADVQRQLDEVRRLASSKAKEPSLSEILQQVKDLEDNLPRAVAAFKKQYPNGEFDIRVQVIITSDKNAKTPLEFTNARDAGAEKKPDAKKPDDKKADEAKKPDEPAKAGDKK